MPEDIASQAQVAGMGNIRSWAGDLTPEFIAELRTVIDRRKAAEGGKPVPFHFLAISGGGANGAYGAGLLAGWTAAGTRPSFDLVTGISTGALSAPFAFLGPEYDETLKTVYTTLRDKDIYCERGYIEALTSDSFADTKPLERLVRRYVTEDLLARIAAEYAGGRVLLIGTTNLDAEQGVIWNMGAIAAAGTPQSAQLFRDVLVASASIPVAFPPKMLTVEANGRRYQEMHVDGGTVAQVFVYPPSYDIDETDMRERHVYVIRNGYVTPVWDDVKRSTFAIGARTIDSMIRTQGIGDLYRIYLVAQRDNVDFSLAVIPPTFNEKPRTTFDPVYMSHLYEVGFADGLNGAWRKYPPGFVPNPTTRP